MKSESFSNYLGGLNAQSIFQILFVSLAIFFFLKAIFKKTKGTDINEIILIDMAINRKNQEISLYDYGKYGQSVVPTNETWKQWISALVKTTKRKDLDYYNFGSKFYFYDLENRRVINMVLSQT